MYAVFALIACLSYMQAIRRTLPKAERTIFLVIGACFTVAEFVAIFVGS